MSKDPIVAASEQKHRIDSINAWAEKTFGPRKFRTMGEELAEAGPDALIVAVGATRPAPQKTDKPATE